LSYSSPTESYSQPAQSQLYTPAAAAYSTEPTYEDEEEEEGGDSDEDDSDSDEAGIGVDSGDFDESADSAFESAGGLLTGSLTE
jgi:hypothetical protein